MPFLIAIGAWIIELFALIPAVILAITTARIAVRVALVSVVIIAMTTFYNLADSALDSIVALAPEELSIVATWLPANLDECFFAEVTVLGGAIAYKLSRHMLDIWTKGII